MNDMNDLNDIDVFAHRVTDRLTELHPEVIVGWRVRPHVNGPFLEMAFTMGSATHRMVLRPSYEHGFVDVMLGVIMGQLAALPQTLIPSPTVWIPKLPGYDVWNNGKSPPPSDLQQLYIHDSVTPEVTAA